MNFIRTSRRAAPLVAGAALLFCGLMSAHASANPPIRMADGVEYMCGGANKDEASFLKMVAPRWAATLEFALGQGARGAAPGDVQVLVLNKYTGKPVMEATATGPLMLARLEPGDYAVEATVGGVTLTQELTVFNGMPTSARFVWPSNIDVPPLSGRTMLTQGVSASSH
ncbi:hypothetical protein [Variovorax sp. UMC13]|uniref:hypothetical protein n=1 Tax=Variovorax sp. UMC13 TaxID=1862326 RepID=UPI0016002971|nr:hypothetical protein [Variovorax sp. UMC13]MBB1604166.1 hypothetical protein [Variovorax sp. UMC13]